MDSRIYIKPIFNRLRARKNLDLLEQQQELDPHHHIADTNTWIDLCFQKEIKRRNKILEKPIVKQICCDSEREIKYLWNSDPARHGEVYDSGEVDELNKRWEKEAVIRDLKKGLIRVSTGRPVYWSETEGKWIDLVEEDRSKWK
jgi:hypothetical protein